MPSVAPYQDESFSTVSRPQRYGTALPRMETQEATMPQLENDAARLKSIAYLLGEALRISDEGRSPIVGAKIADCMDCVGRELADITDQMDRRR